MQSTTAIVRAGTVEGIGRSEDALAAYRAWQTQMRTAYCTIADYVASKIFQFVQLICLVQKYRLALTDVLI